MSLLSKSKKKDSTKSKEKKTSPKKVARSRSKSGSTVKGSNKTKNIKGIMDKISFKIKKTTQCDDSNVVQTKPDDFEKVEIEPEVIQVQELKTNIADKTTHEEDNAENGYDTNSVLANRMTVAESIENIIHDTNSPDENINTITAMGNTLHATNSFTKDIQANNVMLLEHEMVGPGKYMLEEDTIVDDEGNSDETEDPQDNKDTQEGVTGKEVQVKDDKLL